MPQSCSKNQASNTEAYVQMNIKPRFLLSMCLQWCVGGLQEPGKQCRLAQLCVAFQQLAILALTCSEIRCMEEQLGGNRKTRHGGAEPVFGFRSCSAFNTCTGHKPTDFDGLFQKLIVGSRKDSFYQIWFKVG